MIGPSPSQTTNVMKNANHVMCKVLIFALRKFKRLNFSTPVVAIIAPIPANLSVNSVAHFKRVRANNVPLLKNPRYWSIFKIQTTTL